ncbi:MULTISPECIES: DegV family protein [Acutalibacteraceae]|uniref:DegV family protein n=1 Tax=Acutalibacteraceae TaxID=3082771 RepID=UPI0013E8A7A0|nr:MULTISPECIES: DegV family protein [Acutalibacteraceae]
MADYVIAAASTADLPREFFEEHDVPLISYSFMLGDKICEDDCREKSREEMYRQMRQGAILTTSMINVLTYYEFFKKLMDTGKDVIFLDMSRELSHSYVTAGEAAERIRKEYPNRRFYQMDTRCVSGGLGLLVINLVRLRDEGKSFDEVIAWGEANKLKIIHRFTVDDLNYLKRGGRVSNASALVGSLLSIKPVLYVSDEGKLVVASKVRGRKAALLTILNRMKEDLVSPDGQEIHILHADCLADAELMRDKILETFPTVGKVVITSLGVVIGAHCGPGLFTIFYFGDKRCP